LDISAVLAYYFEVDGADRVQALLADTKNPPSICCVTELEFGARLKSLGAEARLAGTLKSKPLSVGSASPPYPSKASGLLEVKTHFLLSSKLFLDIEGLNPKTTTTKQIPSSATEKALFGLNVY
jgi:hypothetical protein